jgi:hypothetical protein
MSAIQDLMVKKLQEGRYTDIESLIMMHRRKYPETCEKAAAELAALVAERDELENKLEAMNEVLLVIDEALGVHYALDKKGG